MSSKKKRRGNSNVSAASLPSSANVKVIRIKPSKGIDPIGGFVVLPLAPFMDVHMTNPLFHKASTQEKQKLFKQSTQCTHRAVTCKNIGHDVIKNDKGHGIRGMCFSFADDDMTPDKIQTFVNDTLAPSIWNHIDRDHCSKAQESDLPKLTDMKDPVQHWEVDNWSDAIVDVAKKANGKDDFNIPIVLNVILKREDPQFTLKTYLREHKDLLCTIYHPGQVPLHIIRDNNIEITDLHDDDKARVVKDNIANV